MLSSSLCRKYEIDEIGYVWFIILNFEISAAEGEQGVTVLGFSFTGDVVTPGSGPIVEVIYNVGMVDFDTENSCHKKPEAVKIDESEELFEALSLGVKDYFQKSGL